MPPEKTRSLTEEVSARARAIRRGPLSWHDRLPDKVRDEVFALRDALHAGQLDYSQSALAKALEESLKARGVSCPKWGEISKWLAR